MKENFPNLAKELDIQAQEAQRVPKMWDPKKNTPRHIIIKLPKIKDKERSLKTARVRERVTYKAVPIRLSADFWTKAQTLPNAPEVEQKKRLWLQTHLD